MNESPRPISSPVIDREVVIVRICGPVRGYIHVQRVIVRSARVDFEKCGDRAFSGSSYLRFWCCLRLRLRVRVSGSGVVFSNALDVR